MVLIWWVCFFSSLGCTVACDYGVFVFRFVALFWLQCLLPGLLGALRFWCLGVVCLWCFVLHVAGGIKAMGWCLIAVGCLPVCDCLD